VNHVKISPSILSANFARLGEHVTEAEDAGVDYIHVDVMDGHFVPNIPIGPLIVKAQRTGTKLPLEVHLLIADHSHQVYILAQQLDSDLWDKCHHNPVQLLGNCTQRRLEQLATDEDFLSSIQWVLEQQRQLPFAGNGRGVAGGFHNRGKRGVAFPVEITDTPAWHIPMVDPTRPPGILPC